jgi:hypothetical protein
MILTFTIIDTQKQRLAESLLQRLVIPRSLYLLMQCIKDHAVVDL